MEQSNLIEWIEKLNEARILVVGDVMLDRFEYGDISRISPEAPVPVLRSDEAKSVLGGAGNVVRNLVSLGCRVEFISVVGDDPEAREIRQMIESFDGIGAHLFVERQRKTTVKTRFIAGRQQVLRVDKETTHPLEKHSLEMVRKTVSELADHCDVIVMSDYGKGLLSRDLPKGIIEIGREKNKPVFVDPKGTDYIRYRGASLLTPNLKELREATSLPVHDDASVVTAAKRLIHSCELDAVLVTKSQDGMSLVPASGEIRHIKAEAKEVFDVSGAGDTVIALLAAASGAGASLYEASSLANVAAGIVVGKAGTAVTYKRDLIHALYRQELSSVESKVLDVDTAADKVELWRREGYKIGFTNGIFDLLHPGHLSLLSQAAKSCDRLIVGLNGDISARRLKGEEPIQHETARSAILASLKFVDIVIIFPDETPVPLIEALRPDVLIKGSNYRPEEVVGSDLVESYGGKIILADIDASITNSKITRITKGIL